MRFKLKKQFISCLLSVILLFTIGMIFETGNNNYADAPPNLSVEADSKVHIVDFIKLPLLHSPITNIGSAKLASEGYVNGKYANLMKGNVKQSVRVEPFSDTYTIEKSVVGPIPQPAVNEDIAGAPTKPTSTVKSDSGLFEVQIEEIFKGTSLAGYGLEKAILEVEEEYGINAFFTIAVMKLESAIGKSKIAMDKNNLFGLNAIDGDEYNQALSFNSKADSVRKFGQLISINYINKGYTTLEKVASKYCEANPKWPGLVKSIMEGDYRKLLH